MVKQISDNEIYLLIKYIKSVLWRATKRLPYKQDALYLKVNRVGTTVCSNSPTTWHEEYTVPFALSVQYPPPEKHFYVSGCPAGTCRTYL